MSFEEALQDVLKVEGGYVDNPMDHGGPTNFGITIGTLSDFLGHSVIKEEVQNLDMDTVRKIYKQNYWDRLSLDQVVYKDVAAFLFDQAVNRGTRKVSEQIQHLVGVPADGIIGPQTIHAINLQEPRKLLLNIIKVSQNTYTGIVAANPNQVTFLGGWIKRTHKFLDRVI